MKRTLRMGTTALLSALATAALVWATPPLQYPAEPVVSQIEQPAVGIKVGQQAPDFSLPTPDGKTLKLSELRGRPVFLNFWATWCPPCRFEMPFIQAAYAAGTQVQIVAIDWTETEKNPAGMGQFLRTNGYTFPVLLDARGEAAGLYRVKVLPTSVFIDSQGVVQGIHLGAMDEETLTKALQKLEPL